MPRYHVTTAMGRSEARVGLTHRVVDTKGSDGNVALCPTVAYCTAEAEALKAAAALNEVEPAPSAWADLSRDAQTIILNRASAHGGGFVSRLADAWMRADSANSAKLGEAFGAMLLEHYGDA